MTRMSFESAAPGAKVVAPPSLNRNASYPAGSVDYSSGPTTYSPYASAPPSGRPDNNPRLQQRHSMPADFSKPTQYNPKQFPPHPQFTPPLGPQNPQISPRAGPSGSKFSEATQQSKSSRPVENTARHLAGLDQQVRRLSEALYTTQQEAASVAASTYEALRILLGVVASFDHDAENRSQSESPPSIASTMTDEMYCQSTWRLESSRSSNRNYDNCPLPSRITPSTSPLTPSVLLLPYTPNSGPPHSIPDRRRRRQVQDRRSRIRINTSNSPTPPAPLDRTNHSLAPRPAPRCLERQRRNYRITIINRRLVIRARRVLDSIPTVPLFHPLRPTGRIKVLRARSTPLRNHDLFRSITLSIRRTRLLDQAGPVRRTIAEWREVDRRR